MRMKCITLILLLSGCSTPCITAGDIEYRSDCAAFGQVMAGMP